MQFFAPNSNTSASEPVVLKGTPKCMLTGLDAAPGATVVMDAGIFSEANLVWLRERQLDPALATEVQSAGEVTIKLQRVQSFA